MFLKYIEKSSNQVSWKSVHWESSCSIRTDGRTNGCTNTTKLIVTFRRFANAPNNDGGYVTIHRSIQNIPDGSCKNHKPHTTTFVKTAHVHPATCNLAYWLTRHGNPIIYRCFALPQLLCRWRRQSGIFLVAVVHTVNFKDGKFWNDQCCCYMHGLKSTSNSFPNTSSISIVLIRCPETAWTCYRRGNSLVPAGIRNQDRPTPNLVTVPTSGQFC
jgi:hypothetical protein